MNTKYNLNIDPEILKKLEKKAKDSNQTLESYIESVLNRFIAYESLISSQSTSKQKKTTKKNKFIR